MPLNVTAGVLVRLPGAVIGAAMVVTFAGILGPTWGAAIGYGWLAGGVLASTRQGERLLAVTVMRFRRASDSWLAAEVNRLAPGRRYEVYVAPMTSGVFALGGYTVGIGEYSVGNGVPTPALQAAAVAAVGELRSGRTRSEVAMTWWTLPWLFTKMTLGFLVPRRWHPVLRVLASVMFTVAVLTCVRGGQLAAAALGVCFIGDLLLAANARRRTRGAGQSVLPRLAPAEPAAASPIRSTHWLPR